MDQMTKPLLKVLRGEVTKHRPIWLMRQAGRYLPEYRELRAKAGSFLTMCYTPELASEITLQPIRRFGFDAAILFSDILVIPHALGLTLDFREGEGPVLQTVVSENDLACLIYNPGKLAPISETLRLVKPQLPVAVTLIGFCGAPWTVACYMIDGNSKNDFKRAKEYAQTKPEFLDKLIRILTDASEQYLSAQIESGAEVLQLFESWAGLLSGADFRRFVIEPTRELVRRIKAKYPHVPIIGFPREAGDGYTPYIRETGIDAMSIDQHVDLETARRDWQSIKPVQGNLDPEILLKGGAPMRAAIEKILTTLGPQHIMNLGHGILPQTPIAHVEELIRIVRG